VVPVRSISPDFPQKSDQTRISSLLLTWQALPSRFNGAVGRVQGISTLPCRICPYYTACGIIGTNAARCSIKLFANNNMIQILSLFLLCAMTVWAEKPANNDAELGRQLLGTWVTEPTEKNSDRTTATYHANGTGEEEVHIGKGADVKIIRLTTRWSVIDGKLCLDSVTSSNPKMIPVGLKLKDIIVSISNDRLVLEAFEGYGSGKGTRATRVRKPAPKQGEQVVPSDGHKPSSSASTAGTAAPADAH